MIQYQLDSRLDFSKTQSVVLKKNEKNLIGISIGGGSPYCPCLYIVQVYENSPASLQSELEPGDEIISVDGNPCQGWSKNDLAKFIQQRKNRVSITYSKFYSDLKEGLTFDIMLKKLKHRFVENMSCNTADAFGFSRAILCNDGLVAKVRKMEDTSKFLNSTKELFSGYIEKLIKLEESFKKLSEIFSQIGCHEMNVQIGENFIRFSELHSKFRKFIQKFLEDVEPVIENIRIFTSKIIPDSKLTLKKYLNSKFEYLSFCLKVKEIEDSDATFTFLSEAMLRMETGNYEYRMNLKCRHLSRNKFLTIRKDMLEKLELLDQKHVENMYESLQKFAKSSMNFYKSMYDYLNGFQGIPLETVSLRFTNQSYE